MNRYSTILDDDVNLGSIILCEPEVMYQSGLDELHALKYKQKIVNSLHKFLFFSSDVTSLSSLNISYKRHFYSYDTSVTVNAYADIDLINETFYFLNPVEIKRFLFFHPELIRPLLFCQLEIISRFDIVKPKAELVIDDELPDWKTLFISIPLGSDADEAFDKLNDLFQNWILYQSKNFRRLVTISLE